MRRIPLPGGTFGGKVSSTMLDSSHSPITLPVRLADSRRRELAPLPDPFAGHASRVPALLDGDRPRRRGALRRIPAALYLVGAAIFVVPATATPAGPPTDAPSAAPANAPSTAPSSGDPSDDSTIAAPAASIAEELTVTDTRLYDEPDDRLRVPAHVTVISRDRIERSGARTLQDLLSLEAGVVVFDQVGNDLQKSFDLRGFGDTGTRVFLDGAPLNEPRNNTTQLELIPLQALDRIEITRGSVGAIAGGGSEAGVINLWTRRGEGMGGSVSAAAGDFSTREVEASARRDFGAGDLFLSGGWEETDGFRDNSGGDLERFQGSFGWNLGPERRLALSLLRSDADFGTPGSLTLAELTADPGQAPFNQLDFLSESMRQATLNISTGLGRSLELHANLFGRDRGGEILTTGRAAASFGGFASGSDAAVWGSTVQIGHGHDTEAGNNRLVAGAEWLDGETGVAGFFTTPDAPGTVDPAGLFSDNTALRRTLGLYAHDTWQAESWTFAIGARWDDDRVGYDESFPVAGNEAHRDFSELSLRAGVSWSVSPASAIYLSFGEAFLPPTVEQLFSFPLFGSNPALVAEDSRSWELGYRRRLGRALDLDAAAFRISSDNTILFDPDSPLGLFGANINAGSARRQGLELALRGRTGRRASPFATLTLVDSELRSGENAGNRLPLVPKERATVGVDLDLAAGVTLHAEGLHVGEQVLQNDESNLERQLDAYDVVNLRAAWHPAARASAGGRTGARARGLVVFVEARNVFDEEYSTRGIFAFDFSTFVNEVFVTPAPGRRFLGGVGWEF